MRNPFGMDFHDLISSADALRRKKWDLKTFFVRNVHLNYTNVCLNHCLFCAFAKNKADAGAYDMSDEEAVRYVSENGSEAREIHIVGGLHPDYGFERYEGLVAKLKSAFPDKTVKGFTAVEIDYFVQSSGLSPDKILGRLKDAGLEMMPGGGAEIFEPSVRNRICPEKISAERWLEIHEAAHKRGITTNATMLYGHLETEEHRFAHLLKLRELQDKTGGFSAFIPLSFQPVSAVPAVKTPVTGTDDLRTVAAARLVLDNVPHIKAYWVMTGSKTAQIALRAGADDLDGTVVKENIADAAGCGSENSMTADQLIFMVKSAGLIPVERDSFYGEIKVYE